MAAFVAKQMVGNKLNAVKACYRCVQQLGFWGTRGLEEKGLEVAEAAGAATVQQQHYRTQLCPTSAHSPLPRVSQMARMTAPSQTR
ncbi:hypothetical protein FOCC_FOCC000988 [Frankliniella occidentalis]|nr:hypothetical protein FOCC_FOCC000988 [Frankliniella occidentalis]